MTNKKIRYQLLTDADLAEEVEAHCRRAKITKSDFFSKALKAFIDQRGETEIDRRYCRRLNKLSDDLDRVIGDLAHVRTDVEMIVESLALFIRLSIRMSAHVPEPDAALEAIARERLLKFVEEVGRRIARNRRPYAAREKAKENAGKEVL